MKFLDMFIEDCKYYDLKNVEIKSILKHVNLKGKTLLDIGAGIGRMSFPLARYAKGVIALDKDRRFLDYFKKHKKKNIKFVNQKAERYLKKREKFDIILLAWPTINFKFIDLIKKAMHKNTIFIFITCDNNSDFETIVDKLKVIKRGYFNKDIKNKKMFMKILPKKFKQIFKRKLKTEYLYPNEKIAFNTLKITMNLWFNIKSNRKIEERLKEMIKKHKINRKVRFNEEIWFYIFKLK